MIARYPTSNSAPLSEPIGWPIEHEKIPSSYKHRQKARKEAEAKAKNAEAQTKRKHTIHKNKIEQVRLRQIEASLDGIELDTDEELAKMAGKQKKEKKPKSTVHQLVAKAPMDAPKQRKSVKQEGDDGTDGNEETGAKRQRADVLKRIKHNITAMCEAKAVETYQSGPKTGNKPAFKVLNLTIDISNLMFNNGDNAEATKILKEYTKHLLKAPISDTVIPNTTQELTTLYKMLNALHEKLQKVAVAPGVDQDMLDFFKAQGIDPDATVFDSDELVEATPSRKRKRGKKGEVPNGELEDDDEEDEEDDEGDDYAPKDNESAAKDPKTKKNAPGKAAPKKPRRTN